MTNDKEVPIEVLVIDRAWVNEDNKGLISYILVDPDDIDHELVTPRGSNLGKLLLKEINEVAQEREDNRIAAILEANGGTTSGEFVSHPYGSAGDDTDEVRHSGGYRAAIPVRLVGDGTFIPLQDVNGRVRGPREGGGVSPW